MRLCLCVHTHVHGCVRERERKSERESLREIEFLYVEIWMYGGGNKEVMTSSPVFILTVLYPQLGCIFEGTYQELMFSYRRLSV